MKNKIMQTIVGTFLGLLMLLVALITMGCVTSTATRFQ